MRSSGVDSVVLDEFAQLDDSGVDYVRGRLLEHGSPQDLVTLVHAGGHVSAQLDSITHTTAQSLGWEFCMLPSTASERRIPRLPQGVEVQWGIPSDDELENSVPGSSVHLAVEHLDRSGSLVAKRHGEVFAWVPVFSLSPSAVTARAVLVAPAARDTTPTRLTILRLGLISRVIEHYTTTGTAVISWIPDDGDPVNEYKAQVGKQARVTQWFTREVRRDLTPWKKD